MFLFKDGGVESGRIVSRISGELALLSEINNADIKFKGKDDNVTVTALTLDMSAAGAATFNSSVTAVSGVFKNGADASGTTIKVQDNADRGITITSPTSNAGSGLVGVTGTVNGLKIGVRDYPDALSFVGSSGEVIFNDSSNDVDFRVESNGNANMLFVDGGNDAVGIGGTAVATSSLSVTGQYEEASGDGYDYNIALVPDVSLSIAQGKGTGILFQSEDTNSAGRHAANIQSFRAASNASNYANGLRFSVRPNGSDMQEVLRLKPDEAVFNENSRDVDFPR